MEIMLFLCTLNLLLSIALGGEPPSIQPIPINGHLVKGQRFKLGCTVFSGSTPMHFEWFKDGQKIISDKQLVIRSSNDDSSDLIINSIKVEDAGTYKCEVKNDIGLDSIEVKVQVKGNFSMLYQSKNFSLIFLYSTWKHLQAGH